MIKIFYNSKVACKYCSLAVSFMERYKFEYKTIDISDMTIDISVSENEKEYDMAENVLMEQMESSSVLPYIIIDDTYGFAGFPEVKDEYQVLEYIQRVKK